jgi:hypothetical protein
VRWIRGNGEREVARALGGSIPADDDLAARTAAITAAEIGEDGARALGELPLTLELDGVLFCHASPRRDPERTRKRLVTQLERLGYTVTLQEGAAAA